MSDDIGPVPPMACGHDAIFVRQDSGKPYCQKCVLLANSQEGRKDDADKLRFDLIPVRPYEALAWVFTIGAKKYADRNWEKGLRWGRVFAAMMRHAWAWWGGEKFDPKDGQHHLAAVAWGALVLMEFETTHPELDDRVKGAPK